MLGASGGAGGAGRAGGSVGRVAGGGSVGGSVGGLAERERFLFTSLQQIRRQMDPGDVTDAVVYTYVDGHISALAFTDSSYVLQLIERLSQLALISIPNYHKLVHKYSRRQTITPHGHHSNPNNTPGTHYSTGHFPPFPPPVAQGMSQGQMAAPTDQSAPMAQSALVQSQICWQGLMDMQRRFMEHEHMLMQMSRACVGPRATFPSTPWGFGASSNNNGNAANHPDNLAQPPGSSNNNGNAANQPDNRAQPPGTTGNNGRGAQPPGNPADGLGTTNDTQNQNNNNVPHNVAVTASRPPSVNNDHTNNPRNDRNDPPPNHQSRRIRLPSNVVVTNPHHHPEDNSIKSDLTSSTTTRGGHPADSYFSKEVGRCYFNLNRDIGEQLGDYLADASQQHGGSYACPQNLGFFKSKLQHVNRGRYRKHTLTCRCKPRDRGPGGKKFKVIIDTMESPFLGFTQVFTNDRPHLQQAAPDGGNPLHDAHGRISPGLK